MIFSSVMLRKGANFVRSRLAKVTEPWRFKREVAAWKRLASTVSQEWEGGTDRLLIFPSDTWTLVGAVGDEAMMVATIGYLRSINPNIEVRVAVASEVAAEACRQRGWIPMLLWAEPYSLSRVMEHLREYRPTITAALGADIMDGYYNPVFSAQMLAVSDMAARLGAYSTILGFSFNASPYPGLSSLFSDTHPRLQCNVRDSISLKRFRAFTGANAQLTADCAFLLEAEQDLSFASDILSWISGEREEGRIILGFNIHPMLLPNATEQQVQEIIASALDAIRHVAALRRVSFLLISHDYRGDYGDYRCLGAIADRLLADGDVRYMAPKVKYNASQLKAIAGQMDGVVGARMHLLIATLGAGRPVAAVTYQDKFAGLFNHFAIDPALMISPAQMINDKTCFSSMIMKLIDELELQTSLVVSRRGEIMKLSSSNFPEKIALDC